MKNRDTDAAWQYHDGTKHSYLSIRTNPHFMDWANRPLLFKIYPKIEPIPLPQDVSQTGVSALSAISTPVNLLRGDAIPSLQDLARILIFSVGITKKRVYPDGENYFRAAACTGALYEIELYVVTSDLPGLDAGVYHFNPGDVSLRQFARGLIGGMRGNIRRGLTGILAGTTVCSWQTCWRFLRRRGCRPRSCWVLWTPK
jgi:hypothetical protein